MRAALANGVPIAVNVDPFIDPNASDREGSNLALIFNDIVSFLNEA